MVSGNGSGNEHTTMTGLGADVVDANRRNAVTAEVDIIFIGKTRFFTAEGCERLRIEVLLADMVSYVTQGIDRATAHWVVHLDGTLVHPHITAVFERRTTHAKTYGLSATPISLSLVDCLSKVLLLL